MNIAAAAATTLLEKYKILVIENTKEKKYIFIKKYQIKKIIKNIHLLEKYKFLVMENTKETEISSN
jgi:hypothetical protein